MRTCSPWWTASTTAWIAVGGFGSSGRPDVLLDALCELDRRDLHVYVNNVGHDFTGVGRLLHEGRCAG